jgi:hypothetical protein
MASVVGRGNSKIPTKSDIEKPVGDVAVFRDPKRRIITKNMLVDNFCLARGKL